MICCTSDGMAGRSEEPNGAAKAPMARLVKQRRIRPLRRKPFIIQTSGINYLDARRRTAVTRLYCHCRPQPISNHGERGFSEFLPRTKFCPHLAYRLRTRAPAFSGGPEPQNPRL